MQFALSVVNSGCYEDDDDGGEITKYTGLPFNSILPKAITTQ